MPFSDGDEHELVGRLRDAGEIALSLVAERSGEIVGHVLFTPAVADNGRLGWFALGPVSVTPEWQRRGIGTRLIEAGLALLRENGATGCALVGNPDFYFRFGFRPTPDLVPEGEPAEYYQQLRLDPAGRETVVSFHPLFHGERA